MLDSRYTESLCFCTAAFGKEYVHLAKLLANDLYQFAPNRTFLVLTNKPKWFREHPNVIAIQHWCRGVLPYHERRFAIQQALSLAPSVMYLDADVRICAPVPEHQIFQPGITARSCGVMQKHLQERFDRPSLSSALQRKKQIIEQMADKAGIDLNSPDVQFINEFLFVVTVDGGREQEFLRRWGELAIYADHLGMHKHPTYAMAFAAVKSGFPIYRSEMPGLDFFDDRIEKVKVSKGQSTADSKAKYLQAQAHIEQRPQSLPQRILRRVSKKTALSYNRARVQITSAVFPEALIHYPAIKVQKRDRQLSKTLVAPTR
ncbi:MAG TPA: hypothetical protein V6C78_11655 [Crinalium sp.]